MTQIGRFSELNGIKEESDLVPGLDFRLPQYRREVFLRFYEFHLKYQGHAGAVYYAFPHLFDRLHMSMEEKLWFVFINGCSQNVITTYLLFTHNPCFDKLNLDELSSWFRIHYLKYGWDTDRRYVKNQFEECVVKYKEVIGDRTQVEFFSELCSSDDPYENFRRTWDFVINNFYSFGRLATFSYLEYLKIAGLNLDCDTLFLDNISGSKSHRNGLCKVLGRDDLDWWKNEVHYADDTIAWLELEGKKLLDEARARYPHKDLSYFTLETTLCCYKSWHRPNRRYPNVYNDMFYERIKHAEKTWGRKFNIFWESREEALPGYLRLESTPADPGFSKLKQNHYRQTGQVIMMDREWDAFTNDLNDYIRQR